MAAALGLAACDADRDDCIAVADCALQLRIDDTVYDAIGYVRAAATPAGRADLSSCDDMGPCARGAYFRAHPRQVQVWGVDGYSSSRVVAVRRSGGMLNIFVERSVPRRQAERIFAELRRAHLNN